MLRCCDGDALPAPGASTSALSSGPVAAMSSARWAISCRPLLTTAATCVASWALALAARSSSCITAMHFCTSAGEGSMRLLPGNAVLTASWTLPSAIAK